MLARSLFYTSRLQVEASYRRIIEWHATQPLLPAAYILLLLMALCRVGAIEGRNCVRKRWVQLEMVVVGERLKKIRWLMRLDHIIIITNEEWGPGHAFAFST